jgi:putative PIN family toxin of toxin-antitoxin system
LLQAVARSTGPAAQCLRLVEANVVSLYLSKPILREVRFILTTAIVRSQNLALTDEIVQSFLGKLAYRATVVRQIPHVFDYPRDPDDEKYVDLAASVEANFLVTRDNDLLDLMSDHSIAGKQFRARFHGLSVVGPIEFIKAVNAAGE